MTTHKTIVKRYTNEFSSGRFEQALSYLADDVSFEFVGQARTRGKAELQQGLKKLSSASGSTTHPRTIDRLIEEGDTVVSIGNGSNPEAGEQGKFVFCDVFIFDGDAISRVETYQVPLKVPAAEPAA
jgi:ketosteroid isomerase-like protein